MWERIKKFFTDPGPGYVDRSPKPSAPPASISRSEFATRVMARAQLFAGLGKQANMIHLSMAEKVVRNELDSQGTKVSMNGSFRHRGRRVHHQVMGCDCKAASEAGGAQKI